MKTPYDPRHIQRQKIVQELFEWGIRKKVAARYHPTAKAVMAAAATIDATIEKEATKWPKEKINNIDLAILRLALWELQVDRSQPTKVIIDEAVELAKEFGGETSPDFVNGVLGAVVKTP